MLEQEDVQVVVKPLSENAIAAFFQRLYRRWLGVWYTFSEKHARLAPFLYKVFFFFAFSIGVTIWQYVVMTFLPYAFAGLNGGEWGWPNVPVAAAGGVPYIIFGDALGLGYFISFEIAVFTAQCINFPLQRNITYKSHGNPYFQAMWYFIGWAAVSVAASALWGIINCFFTYLNVIDLLSGLVKTMLTGFITMIIFFFIFMIIFPDRQKQAKTARKRYERLAARGAAEKKALAAQKRAEALEELARRENVRRTYSQAAGAADARAIAWDEAVKALEKMRRANAESKAQEEQENLVAERYAAAFQAARAREEARVALKLISE